MVKSKTNRFDRFLLTHNHRGLILFLSYLSHTRAPPPITGGGRIVDLQQVARLSVLQSSASVSQQYRLVFCANLPVFDFISLLRGSVHQFQFQFDLLPYLCNLTHLHGRWWLVVKAYIP
jgi:hypothetical protein